MPRKVISPCWQILAWCRIASRGLATTCVILWTRLYSSLLTPTCTCVCLSLQTTCKSSGRGWRTKESWQKDGFYRWGNVLFPRREQEPRALGVCFSSHVSCLYSLRRFRRWIPACHSATCRHLEVQPATWEGVKLVLQKYYPNAA